MSKHVASQTWCRTHKAVCGEDDVLATAQETHLIDRRDDFCSCYESLELIKIEIANPDASNGCKGSHFVIQKSCVSHHRLT